MIPEKNVPYLQDAVDADVQKAYDGIMLKDLALEIKIGLMIPLVEGTDVRPRFSERAVQDCYKECIMCGCFDDLTELENITRVRPKYREKDVQAAYADFIENNDYEDAFILKCLSGMEPNTDLPLIKDVIQEGYRRYFEGGYTDTIADLMKLTGIVPSEKLLKKYPKIAEAFK